MLWFLFQKQATQKMLLVLYIYCQTWKISKICALLFQLSSSLILWKIYSSLACFKCSIQSRLHLAVVLTSRGNSYLLEGCQECTFPDLPPESSAQWIWEAKGPSLEGLMILLFLIRPHNCSFWAAPSKGFGWGSDLCLPSLPISSEVQ